MSEQKTPQANDLAATWEKYRQAVDTLRAIPASISQTVNIFRQAGQTTQELVNTIARTSKAFNGEISNLKIYFHASSYNRRPISPEPEKRKRGRPKGSSQYREHDLLLLSEMIEKVGRGISYKEAMREAAFKAKGPTSVESKRQRLWLLLNDIRPNVIPRKPRKIKKITPKTGLVSLGR